MSYGPSIGLDHAKKVPARQLEPEFYSAETTADLVSVEIDPIPSVVASPEGNDFAGREKNIPRVSERIS